MASAVPTNATAEKSYPKIPYHNITISLASTNVMKEVISLTLVVKPVWNGKMLKATQISFGTCITSTLIACYYGEKMSNGTSILVRINGFGTEKIIDRENEINTLNIISSVESMNGVKLLAVFANGICYEYHGGSILDVQTVRDPHIAKLTAIEMAQLHFHCKTIPEPVTSSYASTVSKYIANIPQKMDDLNKQKEFEQIPKISVIEEEIKSVSSAIEKLNLPFVLCHNDLLLSNITYEKSTDKIRFLDYEYSGYNFNCYDIGNHFTAYAGLIGVDFSLYPDKPYQMQWLRDYLEQMYFLQGKDPNSITEAELNKLYVGVNLSTLASHLNWALWGLYQAVHLDINFGFIGYSKQRIDEFMARKEEFYAELKSID